MGQVRAAEPCECGNHIINYGTIAEEDGIYVDWACCAECLKEIIVPYVTPFQFEGIMKRPRENSKA